MPEAVYWAGAKLRPVFIAEVNGFVAANKEADHPERIR